MVTDTSHSCMGEYTTHAVHTCYCGTQWVHSSELAHRLTPMGPASGLTWCDNDGVVWRAPFGTPPPGDPMPAAWIMVKKNKPRFR